MTFIPHFLKIRSQKVAWYLFSHDITLIEVHCYRQLGGTKNLMSGQIRKTIDKIISSRSRGGDKILQNLIQTKLILRGIQPEKFTSISVDDPDVLAKVKAIAKEMNISLEEEKINEY